ncbi:hypothetical protein AAY473_015581 [Plecturocebus cupreus]
MLHLGLDSQDKSTYDEDKKSYPVSMQLKISFVSETMVLTTIYREPCRCATLSSKHWPSLGGILFSSDKQTGFHHVSQAGLKLLTSSDPPASGSQSVEITVMSHRAGLPSLSPQDNIVNYGHNVVQPVSVTQVSCITETLCPLSGSSSFPPPPTPGNHHPLSASMSLAILDPLWKWKCAGLVLLPSLERSGVIMARYSLDPLGLSNSPASASQIAETTDPYHHAQLIILFFVEKGFHHVVQAGLKFLGSSDFLTRPSKVECPIHWTEHGRGTPGLPAALGGATKVTQHLEMDFSCLLI